ncbi:hypothetical protein E8E15_007833 [Penicillium rubens]|jgi:hypothetical protein|uniref:Uncharacterized protein n=1 Tax=Penicillium chrysogenum TaxID=5076 RepID=A0A167V681_PENCH|nr:uncharacterized protein N7525_000170 [Penicillium rubens]KZN90051.1 hypothetical protein EN45_001610 [Penicillium chrysogenum]KAF3024557.1 hypothetical protein E8E15_007833 [Penicillium rubens]KAJ5040060.1 hypothetical protein NUH16_009860 [Penicillium rubens]KAJ5842429.1 hypothetical protein N7525_000170 [Penicillium rubens]KAJ5846998.1 hypothetical protein N7534_010667 [Penicillium rubens]
MSLPQALALPLEPNTLYILLLDLGGNCLFEWKLYLTSTPTTGQTFHITNETGPTSWQHKSEVVYNIASNARVVLALQIGAVGPVLHAALGARLALVPLALYSARFRESLSCRVWVQEALFALDDEGYLGLARSVGDIEQEARQLGMLNKSRGTRSVVRSRAFVG